MAPNKLTPFSLNRLAPPSVSDVCDSLLWDVVSIHERMLHSTADYLRVASACFVSLFTDFVVQLSAF